MLMPVCNEADVIESVLQEWHDQVFSRASAGSELVIDDCSTDGTKQILRQAGARYPYLRVMDSERDGFFNSAMRLYRQARCPLVFFTDSDGQYVAEDFWKIAERIETHDLVHGYKVDRKDPLYRVFASAMFNLLLRTAFSTKGHDVNSAFRLMRKSMVADVVPLIRHLSMLPNAELYLWAEWLGYRIEDVPIRHRHRAHGVSRALPPVRFARECIKVLLGLAGLYRDRHSIRDLRNRNSA